MAADAHLVPYDRKVSCELQHTHILDPYKKQILLSKVRQPLHRRGDILRCII